MSAQSNSKIKFVFVGLAALILGLTFALPTSSQAADQIVWRLDYFLPRLDPETIMIQQHCDEIFEFTEGRLKIEVYPSFSLKLNPRTQLKNLKDGLMEIAVMNVQMLEGQEPSLAVTEAMGVWPSKEAEAKAVEALYPFKKRVYADPWGCHFVATKMMCVQDTGIFSATKPLKTLDDLKGFKLRMSTRRQLEPLKSLGAAPQAMPSGEVYMALKTGVLDGAVSGSRILIYQKWAEVVKYGLERSLAGALAQDVVVNQKAWDSIPRDIQEVVTMVFTAMAERSKVMAVMPGTSASWRRQCEAMGVTYYDLSNEEESRLDDVYAEKWYEDLKKATERTKEAWDVVKPFTKKKM